MPDSEKYVFIATGSKIGETIDFSAMAKAWMVNLVNQWIRKPEFDLPARVIFVHFDFEINKVRVYEHAFPLAGKAQLPSLKDKDWIELSENRTDFKKIDISTRSNNRNTIKTLSITNVYTSIRKSPPGSVMDCSIFSHAYVKGPVLIDTTDTEAKQGGSPDRTSKDMDGRARTDFKSNMGYAAADDDALKNFVNAFDAKGHFRVFGCNSLDVVPLDIVSDRRYIQSAAFQIIFQAFGKPLNNGSELGKKLRRKQQPTDPLTLDMWEAVMNEAEHDANEEHKENPAKPDWKSMSAAQRNEKANKLLTVHQSLDPFFYPSPSTDFSKPPTTQTVSVLWDDLVALISAKISECYIFKAAEVLTPHGVVCHGASPGVGGNNDQDPRNLGLMRVCSGNEKAELGCESGHSYASWLMFYRSFFFIDRQTQRPLEASFDERNYVRYNSQFVELVHKTQ